MTLKTLRVAVVWFIFPVAVALGQQTSAESFIPAASHSQADCTGFITKSKVRRDIIVINGANNDMGSNIRQYKPSESIYLTNRRNGNFSVGEEFSLVRPAKYIFRTSRYAGEHRSLHRLGKPYEDVGRATVTDVTPEGAVAEVSFACEEILPGDIAVPYQPRIIPEYEATESQHFALPNGKRQGTITAARTNFAALQTGDIVYLNLGEKQGAKVGQRYRVFYPLRYPAPWALLVYYPQPRETVGEVVVLSTQKKSSAAIIVNCTRDIDVGYGVELE